MSFFQGLHGEIMVKSSVSRHRGAIQRPSQRSQALHHQLSQRPVAGGQGHQSKALEEFRGPTGGTQSSFVEIGVWVKT
jgi:hypothetical protein